MLTLHLLENILIGQGYYPLKTTIYDLTGRRLRLARERVIWKTIYTSLGTNEVFAFTNYCS